MISFKGYSYPKEVILQAVRWYVAYCLSYRDIEELLETVCIISLQGHNNLFHGGTPYVSVRFKRKRMGNNQSTG